MKPCTFQPNPEKIKKNPPREKFLILQETEAPEKLLIFSQKKSVLIFQEKEAPKKFFIFQETSYISGSNFQSSKNEKTHS